MNEARLMELEIKLAYQEDLLQQLNTIVANQQQQITRLETTCTLLHERQKTFVQSFGSDENEVEIPPHY